MTTGHLADVALGQGDMRRGAALYAECLALARDAGMRLQIARGLEGLAYVAMQVGPAGDRRRAARLLGARRWPSVRAAGPPCASSRTGRNA
jgi:hypothetical protein